MSDERDNICTLLTGFKGTGKSTFSANLGRQIGKHKRVVIFDVNRSPAFNEFEFLSYPAFLSWIKSDKKGVKRMYDTDKEKLILFLADNFRNGLVVFEDCSGYIGSHLSKSVRGWLTDHRMFNVDLIFTFHSIKMIAPFFWDMVTMLVILKTNDKPVENYTWYDKRVPEFKKVFKAWESVKKDPNQYAHRTINITNE